MAKDSDIKKCLICGEEYDRHSQHIKNKHHLTGKEYYDTYIKTKNDDKCLECGKETRFRSIYQGYRKYCSKECMLKHRPQNIKKAILEKYGVDNVRKVASINKQIEETNLERYGCISPFGNKNVQEKAKQTNLEKYGVETFLSSPEVRKQIENTCTERYGIPHIGGLDFIQEKIKDTNLKKYGVEYTFQMDGFRERSKQACLQKYGVEYATQSEVIQERARQTNLKKYGNEHSFLSENNKEKTKQTLLRKYGVENILDSPAIQEQIRKTNLEKFGVEKPFQSKEIQLKALTSTGGGEENKIYKKLSKLFPDTERQYMSEQYPFFCDFYIPSLNLYIEYNGFPTHNNHPYDKENVDDIKEAEELYQKGLTSNFYMHEYETWTQNDPFKVETARKNKIKLLVFYNMKDIMNWINERKEQING